MTRYIEAYGERFGVEPICKALQAAPSSYYAARHRPPSARRQRDEALKLKLQQAHAEHFGGVRGSQALAATAAPGYPGCALASDT